METQCQNFTRIQRNELIKILQKFKELFNVTLGIQETYPVYYELKEDAKPV